jgi:hypothetical protein
MGLADVIATFQTGTYTVTRRAAGTTTAGKHTIGSTSTFSIDASIRPLSGRDLRSLPPAQHGEERRKLYTTTLLRAAGAVPGDSVSIASEDWLVINVKPYDISGHYAAIVSRQVTP